MSGQCSVLLGASGVAVPWGLAGSTWFGWCVVWLCRVHVMSCDIINVSCHLMSCHVLSGAVGSSSRVPRELLTRVFCQEALRRDASRWFVISRPLRFVDTSHWRQSCELGSSSRAPSKVISCRVMSRHVMSSHVMSCHVMSSHVISCHLMSRHVISCHVL